MNASSAKPIQLEFLMDTSTGITTPMFLYAKNAQGFICLRIFIPITPEAHGNNHRMASGVIFSPKEKKDYMRAVTGAILKMKRPMEPLSRPLIVNWLFLLPRPKANKSHTYEYKSTQPDVDGFVKTTKDCLQDKKLFKTGKDKYFMGSGLIKNDSLIIKETAEKAYGKSNTVGIFIQLREAESTRASAPSWVVAMCGSDI